MAHSSSTPRFKIVVVGDGGVGKTAFTNQFRDGVFERKYVATLGVDVCPIFLKTNYGNIIFDIWDTAGQEKFGGLIDGYYVNAHGCIAMFELGRMSTYRNLSKWVTMYDRVNPKTPIFICGSKMDIVQAKPMLTNSINSYSRKLQDHGVTCAYAEISTKTQRNINAPFLWLARELTKHSDLVFE